MGSSASASSSPSKSPSESESASPSVSPSGSPSNSPSRSPSNSPSPSPSASPSPLPAGEVVYTLHGKRNRVGRMHVNSVGIVFGNGVEAYPDGGVPLTLSGLGCNQSVIAVVILESNADAYLYEWDRSANTIRIFSEARIEVSEGATLATTALEVLVFGW